MRRPQQQSKTQNKQIRPTTHEQMMQTQQPTIQQDDEIIQIKKVLKEQQNSLYMKQLEFDVIQNMDTDKIHEMLINKNMVVYEQEQKNSLPELVKRGEDIDPNQMGNRLARKEKYSEQYLNSKPDIYAKLKPIEIKQLQDTFNKKMRTTKSSQVDDKEKQHHEYQVEYMNFLQRQPYEEMTRRKLIHGLADTHQMMSVLKNVPTFEAPALWNKKPLSIEDGQFVQKYVNHKIQEIDNQYSFSLDEIDGNKNDILHEVQRYLEIFYFVGIQPN